MNLIYQFFLNYTPIFSSSQTNVWIVVGRFSNQIDSDSQQTRLIDSGIDANYLRQLTDADPVPTDIPIAWGIYDNWTTNPCNWIMSNYW